MTNKHLLQLWILTLLLAPVVYFIFELMGTREGQVLDSIDFLLVMLILSFAFSLPTLLLAYLAQVFTSSQNFSEGTRKTMNISIAAIGLTCTLLFINGSLIPTLITVYMISLGISAMGLELFARFLTAKS